MGDASTSQFEVVFDYGEHDALAPTRDAAPGVTWPRRQDPFSVYRAGFEMRTWRLCRRVLVTVRGGGGGIITMFEAEGRV
jgi:hypothetical protein